SLERPFRESLEQDLADLRLAIAVPVGEKQDLRFARRDDSSPSRTDPMTGGQTIGPDVGLVHASVPLRSAQTLDRAVRPGGSGLLGFFIGLNPPHDTVQLAGFVQLLDVVLTFEVVAVQLANEELSAFIPAHTGWLANDRFARHQLQAETVGQLDGLFAVLGR